MPDGEDAVGASGTRGARDLRTPPIAHFVLFGLGLYVMIIGGNVTFGSWGTVNVRTAAAYILPAVALHGYASWSSRPWLSLRVATYLLLVAMAIHTRVLLRPAFVAAVALGGLLDVSIAATRSERQVTLSVPARITAGVAAIVAAVLVALLTVYAIDFEVASRLSTAVVLAAAVVIAAAVHPPLRAPQWLLPALGAYYLAFVVVAAPVLPIGPAIAWWMLCASLLVGAAVAARHVSGHETPTDKGRHEHVVHELPDPTVASYTYDVERFLSTGAEARSLSERIERATGRPVTGATLPGLVAAVSKGTRPNRADRERALKELLEVME